MRLIGLAVSLTLAPFAVEAQPPGKVPRVGLLAVGSAGPSPRDAFKTRGLTIPPSVLGRADQVME